MQRLVTIYLRVTAVILAATAAAKVVGLVRGGGLWDTQHPYFTHLTYGNLAEAGLVVEVLALAGLALAKSTDRRLLIVAWTGNCFGLFKGLLYALGVRQPCHCLGALYFTPEVERLVSNAIIAWMLLGSLGLLVSGRAAARGTAAAPPAGNDSTVQS